MGLSCTEYFNCMAGQNESFSHFSSLFSHSIARYYLAHTAYNTHAPLNKYLAHIIGILNTVHLNEGEKKLMFICIALIALVIMIASRVCVYFFFFLLFCVIESARFNMLLIPMHA